MAANTQNNVVGECPVCANDGDYCPNPKCPMDEGLTDTKRHDEGLK